MNRLEVGKIVNTHGLKGEVKIVTWTDYPEVFENIKYVYTKQKNKDSIKLTIKNIKYQNNNIVVKFDGIDSIEEAQNFKNTVLTADREMLGELPEGVYYIADLIGCEVYDGEKGFLGKISDVFNTGANDIYAVSAQGKKDILVPVIDGVVLSVDIPGKKICVNLPEGLDDI